MENKKNILIGAVLGGFLALFMISIFFAGVFVGTKKANKFFPFPGGERHQGFIPQNIQGHGVIGTIDSLNNQTIIVKDRQEALKTVITDSQTKIRRGPFPSEFSDLKKGDEIVVLGEPKKDEGIINAKIIRVISDPNKDATISGFLKRL